MAEQVTTIDDYIAARPDDVRPLLEAVRMTIRGAVPGTGEAIRYQMPTITLDGRSLVHFAAWKRHLGLYPVPATDGTLAQELAPYDSGKGTARFPLADPIPYDLIGRLVALLAEQRPGL